MLLCLADAKAAGKHGKVGLQLAAAHLLVVQQGKELRSDSVPDACRDSVSVLSEQPADGQGMGLQQPQQQHEG